MRPDLATAECAEAFITELSFGFARVAFDTLKQVPLAAWLFCTRNPRGFTQAFPTVELVVAPILPDNGSKDDFAEFVRQLVIERGAIGVVLLSEAWTLSATGADQARVLKLRTIEQEAEAKEVVMISLEHIRTHGTWRAAISRDAKGAGTLGDFVRLRPTEIRGRFTDLLRKERFA